MGATMRIDFKSGTTRAIITFVLTFAALWLLVWILRETFGIEFFGDFILVLIGAGWLSYYVWRKTEVGFY